ncbi:MAG TPA: HtaA domain-containing protein [Pseudolysinimonas sp.]|nr:HtaA domain-containing protein [Pseudolysinimonas sp.]
MSSLIWPVKESFIAYIVGAAAGAADLVKPATRTASGAFVFPGASPSDRLPRHELEDPLRFVGALILTGHGGMLNLPLQDPWVEWTASGYVMSIVDPDEAEGRLPFVAIAGFVTSEDQHRAHGTSLTSEGAELFFGPYNEGTVFDDPVISLA